MVVRSSRGNLAEYAFSSFSSVCPYTTSDISVIMTDFAERLLIARRRARMDSADLAQSVGVTRKTISSWESGRSEHSASSLAARAQSLGVTVTWILYGDEDRDLPTSIDPECVVLAA